MADGVEGRPAVTEAASHRGSVAALATLTVLCVLGCFAVAAPFASALTWAVALSVALHKPYRWLSHKTGKPGLAAVLALLLIVLVLLVPAALVIGSLGGRVFMLVNFVRSGNAQDWAMSLLQRYPKVDTALDHLLGLVNLKEGSKAAAGWLAGKLQMAFASSVAGLTQLAIMLFTLFFLFKDAALARSAFRSVLPLAPDRADYLIERLGETIEATLQGSLTIAAIQGCLGGLAFWVLGVPNALLWALIMGLLATVPSLGTFLVWMPVALFLALTGHLFKAGLLFAWGAGVIGTVDNLLYPTLVGRRLRMRTLPTFFSVLGGIAVFGLSGLVLGPLLLTTAVTLLRLWSPEVLPEHPGAAAS